MDFRGIKEFFKDIFGYIIIAVVIFIIIVYVISLEQVIGPSMNPTLEEGNILIVNKLLYKFKDVDRNEIVVVKHEEKHYIKRVIGLPGEHIEYKNKILYIGDKQYKEPFVKVDMPDFKLEDIGYSIIPENMYLVLGDNRINSEDGRDFGLISKDEIIGRGSMRIWPITQFKFLN